MELPVDEMAFCEGILAALGVEPVMAFVDGGDGSQRVDRDGVALWAVSVAYRGEGDRRPEVLSVRVASEVEPVVVPGPIWFRGVVVRTWEMDGRRGVSFSARSFTQADRVTGEVAAA